MPLPKGYVLDQPGHSAPTPRLPAGYTLDGPSAAPVPPASTVTTQQPLTAPQTTMQRAFGVNPFSDALDVVGNHLKSFATVPYHAFADGPQNPEEARIKGTDATTGPANMLGQFGLGAARMLVQPTRTALRTAVQQGKAGNTGMGLHHSDYDAQGNYQPSAMSSALDAIPLAGPWSRQVDNDAHQHGAIPALLGLATDVGAPLALGKGVSLAKAGVLGDVTKPIGPGGVSPLQRFQSAKALGVNLDAADATNSALLKGVKKVNEHSLLGSGAYEANKQANVGALHSSTNTLLDSMYQGDRESGGAAIQNALKANQQGLRTGAETGFQQLTDETKGQPMAGAPAVGARAQALRSAILPLAEKYPSLAPTKTLSILDDLSNVGAGPKPVMLPTLSPEQQALARMRPSPNSPTALTAAPLDTFADLQRLRSATHDLTTTNPDLVKSQAMAPLQQMTASIDDAMTNAGNGLTPEQTNIFREANSNWADMKGTYDNPSSPLYHAVRTETPSSLYSGNGLGPKTPEMARDVLNRFGVDRNAEQTRTPTLQRVTANGVSSLQDVGHTVPTPAAAGALRRGVVESALKTTNDGSPNFRTFGTQLNRIPLDYRSELFTPAQQETLGHIQNTANVLNTDLNPSGTAKLSQKVAEASVLSNSLLGHPTGFAPLLQYPIAKAMNAPGVVDWMMKPSAKVRGNALGVLPAALGENKNRD